MHQTANLQLKYNIQSQVSSFGSIMHKFLLLLPYFAPLTCSIFSAHGDNNDNNNLIFFSLSFNDDPCYNSQSMTNSCYFIHIHIYTYIECISSTNVKVKLCNLNNFPIDFLQQPLNMACTYIHDTHSTVYIVKAFESFSLKLLSRLKRHFAIHTASLYK